MISKSIKVKFTCFKRENGILIAATTKTMPLVRVIKWLLK